jgi:phage shock protein E
VINFIKNLLGIAPQTDLSEILKSGAQIIDVRSKGEFQSGHIKGSVNIPLHNLHNQITKIKKNKPIITCCASGMRSGSAKSILKSYGFAEVYNGGGWNSLQNKIK